ncbi:MAG: alpha/beta hydrolase [Thermodesulfobacteriota bacterium]|nr:alpha/beta hydrolase [Thermodesulfobacteriota bacterium]
MISKEMQAVINVLQKGKDSTPADLTAEMMRKGFEQMAALNRPPDKGVYKPDTLAGVPVEWVAFPEAPANRIMLYLHGGAYAAGSMNTHRNLCGRLAKATEMTVLMVDYRLAPENPFPAALEDAVAVYRCLIAEKDIKPADMVIAGDSAGGGLTLATMLKLKETGEPLPRAAVCMSPWTDLALTGETIKTKAEDDPFLIAEAIGRFAGLYLNGEDAKNPMASPLYGDLSGLPPLLIQVGDRECLLDDSRRLAERAKAADVPVKLETWEGMVHVFQIFAGIATESARAIENIAEFLKSEMTS